MAKKILYIQYTNPACYPPLEHSSQILADRGWKVSFLGTRSFGESDILTFKDHPNISVKKISYCPAGLRQKFHYAWFCLLVFLKALRWRPQWIYASDPNSCPAALLLSHLTGIKIIYHEHDSPSADFNRRIMCARKKVAAKSELCVLPNEHRMKKFISEIHGVGSKSITAMNCPQKIETEGSRIEVKKEFLSLIYHGTVVPSRMAVSLLKAIALVRYPVKLTIIGFETIGHKGYIRQLSDIASRTGISSRVEFIKPVPYREELFRKCRTYDVGLSFMPKESRDINESNMAGASNKPFDYMACGLALLVSDLPDWRKMYVEPGYGLGCDPESVDSITASLHYFIEHSDETQEMGERGRQKILSDWNYERQFEPVLNEIKRS